MTKPKIAVEKTNSDPGLTVVEQDTSLPMVSLKSNITVGHPMEHSTFTLRTFTELQANQLASHWETYSRAKWEGEVTFHRLFQLLPEGFVFAKSDEDPRMEQRSFVAVRYDADGEIDAAMLIISYAGGKNLGLEVAAQDPDTAAELGKHVIDQLPPPAPDDPKTMWLRTWYHGGGDVDSTSKRIATENWDEISSNYPAGVRRDLDALMAYRPQDHDTRSGRIILFHGAPGTGKTSVVRALCKSWFEWAQPELLVDAEVVFSEAKYLMQVLGRGAQRDGDYRADLWRLLIAEDADLYMTDGHGPKDNPALDRLLNVGDGLLAQGQKVLVLLSTNNKISKLPAALTRPGRCLSIHDFPTFSPKEANEWLGEGGPTVSKPMTLAELYELRGSTARIGTPTELKSVGTYL